MKAENKKEGLQSRREFFKSAAKAALPVIGAVVLANLPIVAEAASGCKGAACAGTCYYSCRTTCDTTCKDTCKGTCINTCKGGCKTGHLTH